MQKICDAIGLPPMLCMFAILGLSVGTLGVARMVMTNYGVSTENGPVTALK
jgi:hypothetical protein